MRLAVGLVALALCAFTSAQASATEFHPVAGEPDNGLQNGICNLREAVSASNSVNGSPGGADCGAATDTNSIVLTAGQYDLAGARNEDANAGGDLDFIADVAIRGAGAGTTIIDAHNIDRLIDIYNSFVISISNVTLTNGHAPDGADGGAALPGNGRFGGAIANDGALTLTGVSITGNQAGRGGTGSTDTSFAHPGGFGGRGGAIFNSGSLTVAGSEIANNVAGAGGSGGIAFSSVSPGGAGGSGGAIFSSGPLTITDSTISGNHAGVGGTGGTQSPSPSPAGAPGDGGGIFSAGTLTMSGSTVRDNVAGAGGNGGLTQSLQPGGPGSRGGAGGGIYQGAAAATIAASSITGNHAGAGGPGQTGVGGPGIPGGASGPGGDGGGIALLAGTLTLTDSTVSGNVTGSGATGAAAGGAGSRGGNGAGLYAGGAAAALHLASSTIAQNTSGNGGSQGGGSSGGAGGSGGGIFTDTTATVDLTNSTVASNAAGTGGSGALAGRGGGIFHAGTSAALLHVTLAANQATISGGIDTTGSGLSVTNSVLASNTSLGCAGTIADGGHNVAFPDATCPGAVGDPKLGALAENGGRTKTMALGAGSAALDVVPAAAGCPTTDQRGGDRPSGPACDAGAFELFVPPPAAVGPGGNQPPPTTAAPDKTAPLVKLLLFRQRLRAVLRAGYVGRFSTSEAGSATIELRVKGKRVATGKLKVKAPGKQRIRAKFIKRAKKQLAKKRTLKVTLVLIVKDAAGNVTRKTAKVSLKR